MSAGTAEAVVTTGDGATITANNPCQLSEAYLDEGIGSQLHMNVIEHGTAAPLQSHR